MKNLLDEDIYKTLRVINVLINLNDDDIVNEQPYYGHVTIEDVKRNYEYFNPNEIITDQEVEKILEIGFHMGILSCRIDNNPDNPKRYKSRY